MDDPPLPVEGHHAIGHVEEEGVQFVAFVLHGGHRVVELLSHGVEALGELADLVTGGDLQLFGKISGSHLLQTVSETLEGSNHGLGQQEGQQDRDDQPQSQGLQNQGKHLAV